MNLTEIGNLSAYEIVELVDGPHINSDQVTKEAAAYLTSLRDTVAAKIRAAIADDGVAGLDMIDSESVDAIGDNFVSSQPRVAWQVFVNLRLIGLDDWDWDEVEDSLDIATVTFPALMRALFFRFNAQLLTALLVEVRDAELRPVVQP